MHCTLHTAHCTLHTAHCTLHSKIVLHCLAASRRGGGGNLLCIASRSDIVSWRIAFNIVSSPGALHLMGKESGECIRFSWVAWGGRGGGGESQLKPPIFTFLSPWFIRMILHRFPIYHFCGKSLKDIHTF